MWDDSAVQYDMPDVIRSFIAFFYKQFKEGNLSTLYVVNDTSVLLGHIHIDDVLMPFLNATVEGSEMIVLAYCY